MEVFFDGVQFTVEIHGEVAPEEIESSWMTIGGKILWSATENEKNYEITGEKKKSGKGLQDWHLSDFFSSRYSCQIRWTWLFQQLCLR